MFRIIITAVIFYLVYYFMQRLLNPRRRNTTPGRQSDAAPTRNRYPDAIDADFEELDKK